MTVARLTLGDLSACLVLLTSQGVGMGWQKSAEAIVVAWNRSSGRITISNPHSQTMKTNDDTSSILRVVIAHTEHSAMNCTSFLLASSSNQNLRLDPVLDVRIP